MSRKGIDGGGKSTGEVSVTHLEGGPERRVRAWAGPATSSIWLVAKNLSAMG